jgi:hypothetical protein
MPKAERLVRLAERVKKSETTKRAVESLSQIYNRWASTLLAGRHTPSDEEKERLAKDAVEFIRTQLIPKKLVPEQDFNALVRGQNKTSTEPSPGLIKLLASMFSEHGGPISDEALIRNYINAYNLVSPEEIAEGRKFYPLARQIAEQLGEYANKKSSRKYDIKQIAAIIASTSPGQGWVRNIADAHKVLNAYHKDIAPFALNQFGDTGMRRAYLVLAGEPLENLFDPVKSTKIGNFAWNIAAGGNLDDIAKIVPPGWKPQIVADRHVFRVGTGERRVESLGSPGLYDRFDEAVKKAASALGVDPVSLQAIVWTGSRTGGVGNTDPRFAMHLLDRTGPGGARIVNLLEGWQQQPKKAVKSK